MTGADEFVSDAAAGDPAATAALIRLTQAEVRLLCARLVDAQAADDLTQETYVRALDALPRFRGESAVRSWLLRIARRVCADEIRARTRRRRRADRQRATTTPDALTVPDVAGRVAVDHLLAGLDPDRRAAFVLTQLLGLPYAEAAEVCECPVGTIRSRVARARTELAAALGFAVSTGRVMPGSRG